MTAQVHEGLIIDGEETSMARCPPLPDDHPRIVKVTEDEINRFVQEAEIVYLQRDFPEQGLETPTEEEKRARELAYILNSTACWRRYVGTWEIKDGRFFLAGLRGIYKLLGAEPVPADWFTGGLRIPRGEMLQYVHMGFGTAYEKELHISIRNGLVVRTRLIDNRGQSFDQLALGWQNLPGGENRFPGDTEDHFFANCTVRCPSCYARSDNPDPDKIFDLVGLCVAPKTDYVLWKCKCGGCKTNFNGACWTGNSIPEFDPSDFDQQLLQRYQTAVDNVAALKGEERNIEGRLTEFKGLSEIDTEFLNSPENESLRTNKVIIPIETLSLARGVRKAAVNSPGQSFACTIGPLDLVVSVDQDSTGKVFSHALRLTITDHTTGAPVTGPALNFGISLVLGYEEFIHWPLKSFTSNDRVAAIEIPWRL